MRKALRHRRLLLPVLGVTVLPLTIAACSSSPAASSGASTTTGNSSTSSAPPADQSECVLISPSTVRATTGEAVGTPHAVIRGAVTTCTYKAAVPSKSVIIEYDTAATPTTFAADKSEIERGKGVTTTSIQGLGNDAVRVHPAIVRRRGQHRRIAPGHAGDHRDRHESARQHRDAGRGDHLPDRRARRERRDLSTGRMISDSVAVPCGHCQAGAPRPNPAGVVIPLRSASST